MKNRKLKLESLLVVSVVFLVFWALSQIPFNLHVIDAEAALRDFDLTDIYFSKIKSREVKLPAVVIVDVDKMGRAEIGRVLNAIAAREPAVVGVDVLFTQPHGHAEDDTLRAAFKKLGEKLVLAAKLNETGGGEVHWIKTDSSFGSYGEGFNNFQGSHETNGTVRAIQIQRENSLAFALAVVGKVDPGKVSRLVERKEQNLLINYAGNYGQFDHYDGAVLLDPSSSVNLKGKFVLVGLGGEVADKQTLEDSHFTPMNEELVGRTFPDIYGVVIHANIVSMILRDDYITEVPAFFNFLLAFVIGYFHVWLYSFYFVRRHVWFHIVAKFSQLITSVVLMMVVIFLMNYGIKFDPGLSLVVILLSVDVLYFYEGIARVFTRVFKWNSWFTVNPHSHG